MADKTINTIIVLRHDTAANWTTNNPRLRAGEMGIETDTKKFKFGDGTKTWSQLGYAGTDSETLNSAITTAIEGLDAEKTQTAGTDGLALKVTEVDGKITAIEGSIAANTYDAYGAASGVLGANTDAATANTVYGAKAAAAAAQSKADANETAITTLNGDSSTTGSVAKSVKDAVDALDSTAGIASASDGVVTIKAGLAQTDGKIANNSDSDITLAKVATTGAAADVSIADSDNKITATTVEGALAELATSISSVSSAGTVTCTKSTDVTGVAARYTFSQGGTAITNAVIDIPKDMVVSSGTVETKGEPGADDEWPSAGTYLVLTLANADNDKIYINVGDLIEYVTSGSQATEYYTQSEIDSAKAGDAAYGKSTSDVKTAADAIQITVDSNHKVSASITDGSIALSKLTSAVQAEINKAHTHDNKSVLDGITSAKVDNWDAAEANVLESVKIGDTALTIADKAVTIPAATASALGLVKVDNSTIQVSDTGAISVKAISTDLLTQGTDTFVLNGGASA